MPSLEPLAADQRAVVALVLQQGRTYAEIAALLAIPDAAVRGRAHAGLAALAPGNGLPAEITGPLADYLLGQQSAADADATRGLLAESAPARTWASDVAARLAPLAPAGLPEIPGAAPEPAPAPAGAPPPASRLGGALLIAGGLALAAVVLFLVLRGGDDAREDPAGTQAATPTATVTPSPANGAGLRVADTIALAAPAGSDATGSMTVYLRGEDQLLFELVAENVPPTGEGAAYAVWVTGGPGGARRLGFANVGADGRLAIQGPSERDVERFPRLYATYENVVVSRESSEAARRPSEVLLGGDLPAGR